MAFWYKLGDLSKQHRLDISVQLVHTYTIANKTVHVSWPVRISHGLINLPISWLNEKRLALPSVHDVKCKHVLDTIVLRPEQEIFVKQVLHAQPTIFAQAWSVRPGFGKTHVCLYVIAYYGIPCTIVVHRVGIKEMWKRTIDQVKITNVKVCMLSEFGVDDAKHMVVVDEAHACVTTKTLHKFTNIFPQILIGLSGTFYRYDEKQAHLRWLFGEPIELCAHAEQVLCETTRREIHIVPIKTNMCPELVQNRLGKLDWTHAMKSLAFNDARNKLIASLVREHSIKSNVLILVRFVQHGHILKELLADMNVMLYFANDPLPTQANVIISTAKKIGTGVSLDHLNCLVFASDFERYSIQYISRVLRVKTQNATVVDLIDQHGILWRHYQSRAQVYRQLGAIFID